MVVARHLFRLRSFSGVCKDVSNERRAHRATAIVVNASITGQIRVDANVETRVVTQDVTCQREEHNERDRAGG